MKSMKQREISNKLDSEEYRANLGKRVFEEIKIGKKTLSGQ
jgi:hypothetical protein